MGTEPNSRDCFVGSPRICGAHLLAMTEIYSVYAIILELGGENVKKKKEGTRNTEIKK